MQTLLPSEYVQKFSACCLSKSIRLFSSSHVYFHTDGILDGLLKRTFHCVLISLSVVCSSLYPINLVSSLSMSISQHLIQFLLHLPPSFVTSLHSKILHLSVLFYFGYGFTGTIE